MAKAISLVIPTFNRKDCLKKTLDSLRGQSFEDFEVIISDDGSTDGTGELLKSQLWPFVLNYYWHEKKGRSFSRNFGVKHSFAPIILFLDDHIILDRDCLKNHLLYHQKLAGTKYQVIRGRAGHLAAGQEMPVVKIIKKISWRERLDEQNPWVTFFTCNTSVSREAFLKVGGFEEQFTEYGFEDNELGYRLRKAGYKFKINPEAVGYIFPYELDFAGRLSKARQVGHMAVVFAGKYPAKKYLVGVNVFNWLVYKIFEKFPSILKRLQKGYQKAAAENNEKNKKFYSRWLEHYNFLAGIEEAKK